MNHHSQDKKDDNNASAADRLIGELLREQSRGPDEDFLRDIERALDAGPAKKPVALPASATRSAGRRLAIAAGFTLLIGGTVFHSLRDSGSTPASDVPYASNVRSQGRTKAPTSAPSSDRVAVDKELVALESAIREQEARVAAREKEIAEAVAALPPSLLEKLVYLGDESLAWVLLPGYGVDGKFPLKYEDSSRQTNKSDAANPVGPGDTFFTTGPMMNRFKLLGSEKRRELNKSINIEQEVTILRIEDQKDNKKGTVYEIPSPLNDQRKNQYLQFDRTAVFSLQAPGSEFKVEENRTFALPRGNGKEVLLLKSVTPAGVVVERTDGSDLALEIKRRTRPDPQALAAMTAKGTPAPGASRFIEADKTRLADLRSRYAELKGLVETDLPKAASLAILSGDMRKLYAQVQAQEDKMDASRQELLVDARDKGVTYSGPDSYYDKPGGQGAALETPSEEIIAAMKRAEASERAAMDKTDYSNAEVAATPEREQAKREYAEQRRRSEAALREHDLRQREEMKAREDARRKRMDDSLKWARERAAARASSRTAFIDPPVKKEEAAPASVADGFVMRGDDARLAPPADAAPSGDRYDGGFVDQPWKTPAGDPLSTFSIDVDTASYANVRRMIEEGREVPKDAVRIEEFINAFPYHYPAPKGDAAFAVGAAIATCPWAPEHQIVRVAIKGREVDAAKRPASNLVFLIDVSGSMNSPDKLPLLKHSLRTMVDGLDERDRVAMVVYAGSEGVALPSTKLDDEGRAKVVAALDRLQAGGSTNGGAGIKRAYQIAAEQKIQGGVNRVILATDGDFNVGVTGKDALVNLVKERAKDGVYLTVAGFGTGNLNDAMMDAITRDGNGNYHYIGSQQEGEKVFRRNLAGTLVAIAKDVKIQVEFNPAKVGGYRLIGYANRVLKNEDFSNDKVDAGDIGAGHTVTAFYEIAPPGKAPLPDKLKYQDAPTAEVSDAPAKKDGNGSDEWLTVKLRHKLPDGDVSSLTEFPLTGTVPAISDADKDFQFATAAALFGMKLRGMEEVKDLAWARIIELARPGLFEDPAEDRAEFVRLVRKAGGIADDVSAPSGVSGTPGASTNVVIAPAPKEDDNLPAAGIDSTDGPNVRVTRHEDGSRSVFARSPNARTLVKRKFSPAGVLVLRTTFRMDEGGNPLGCRITDGQQTELFRVSYGYDKNTGRLVSELMYDSREKRIDPRTGNEMPVQQVHYSYDAEGKRGAPVIQNLLPGKTIEEIIGERTSGFDGNPFATEAAKGAPPPAEVVPGNGGR